MRSFGGGLTGWIRREIVQRRGWMEDRQFISGLALSQLVPGATNVNLAVFIGTQLRGAAGACATTAGLMAAPLAVVLTIGWLYLRMQGVPAGGWVSLALGGAGAVAIGLNLGTGIRLARRNVQGLRGAIIMAVVALAVGVLRFPLPYVLAVMLPVSLALSWWERRE
jgi:chromate transporter